MDLDFEQSYWSRIGKSFYKLRHDSIKILKWMAFYDKYYENIN